MSMHNQRYRIFLFPWISSFLRIFEEYRMNEWKSCFFSRFVFFFRPKNRMNEWPSNLSVEKKKNKKINKSWRKKKHKQLLLKKSELDQNLIEWPMNLSAEKKNTTCFFSALRKKKTRFSDLNEWMTNELIRGNKKIRYLWFNWSFPHLTLPNGDVAVCFFMVCSKLYSAVTAFAHSSILWRTINPSQLSQQPPDLVTNSCLC